MLSNSLLPTGDHVLRARDHVLRTGASLLRTSRVPGHLSTPVLGPLQDNLLRPTGYGLGLLRLELPCAGVFATLPRIQKSGHQLEGALVQSPFSPLVTSRKTVMFDLPRVDRTGDTRASGRNCGIFNCWAKLIWATIFSPLQRVYGGFQTTLPSAGFAPGRYTGCKLGPTTRSAGWGKRG